MPRRILIGTDEAGYGPNLGPLTVAATAWGVPDGVEPRDLWKELERVLSDKPGRGDQRLFVADSKKVFSPGEGLESLEVAVLAFLNLLKMETASIDRLCQEVSLVSHRESFVRSYTAEQWNSTPGLRLPIDSSEDHIAEWVNTLSTEFDNRQIQFLGVRARIIFPAEFNQLVSESGTKGAVLSNATLQLVRELSDLFANETPTYIVCDKHGGRNRYDELISQNFDDKFVFRLEESREKSSYRLGALDFCFRTKAEQFLPVALASMVAKYTREVLMHQFNAFWAERVPGIRPTQGYPQDAKRFRDQVAAVIDAMNLPPDQYWRSR